MLDISNINPFVACTNLALEWLAAIARHDFEKAEAIIDLNESGKRLAEVFPVSSEFTYCDPAQIEEWNIHFLCADSAGFFFEFDVPFVEPHYRAMVARFSADRKGSELRIRFDALVPS